MKIIKIESKIIRIPVEKPYVFSHGELKEFGNVLVWVHTDEGIVGVGEASFVPGVE